MGWIAEFLGLSVTLASGAALTLLLWIWGHNASTRFEHTLESRDFANEVKLAPKN
jgi:hypothetical protein